MYEAYFHLREKPFDLLPNPAYLYLSRTHRQAMTYCQYGLQERIGFVLMTGEVGSGKTTLIRELIRTMSPDMMLARLFNTRVTSEELIAMINEDFGIDTGGKGKVRMLKDLYEYLIQQYEQGRRPVLIIDEAQNLSLDLLEEVRMLSNLETNSVKLLQIIIVGQPELAQMLACPEMRQLRQRINIMCHIKPLTREETEGYILHRFDVAGNREALVFDTGAFDEIFAASGGIPRQINTLCSFILLTAFTEERHDVSRELVRDVAEGIGMEGEYAMAAAAAPAGKGCTSIDAAPSSGNGTHAALIRDVGFRLKAIGDEIAKLGMEGHAELHGRLEAVTEQLRRAADERRPDQPAVERVATAMQQNTEIPDDRP